MRTAVFALLAAACSGDRPAGVADGGGGDAAPDPCAPIGDRPGVCPARGLYPAPVMVELRGPDGADVFYTLDGSAPDPGTSPIYADPIEVGPSGDLGLVVLRARAAGSERISTHSYLFAGAIVAQPAAPAGFPLQWGNTETTAADYAMDPRVAADPAAFGDLATVSIVMAPGDLFGVERGIYMNPEMEGIEWERPASIEVFGDDLSLEVAGGIRIQGGSSTLDWKVPKLSMRLSFRGQYDAPELEADLFGRGATTRFDNLILDAHLNYTWIHPTIDQRTRADYLRDRFISDLQLALGSLAPRGRFVHLYLNGLYWGIYELHERPDEHFAADYLGGRDEDYDVLKHNGGDVVSGDAEAWNQMFALARAGLADEDNHAAFEELLDVDHFIAYMLVNLWGGNDDWPHKNYYAARRRPDGRFRFFSWDAEHTLKDVNVDRTGEGAPGGPGELYQALLARADFRAQVRARAEGLLADGEPLSSAGAAALYQVRASEIRRSIALEAARWGDSRQPEPHLPAEWEAEQTWLAEEYFPARPGVFTGQLPAP
jgi:hypothetical protein